MTITNNKFKAASAEFRGSYRLLEQKSHEGFFHQLLHHSSATMGQEWRQYNEQCRDHQRRERHFVHLEFWGDLRGWSWLWGRGLVGRLGRLLRDFELSVWAWECFLEMFPLGDLLACKVTKSGSSQLSLALGDWKQGIVWIIMIWRSYQIINETNSNWIYWRPSSLAMNTLQVPTLCLYL